MLFIRIVAVSLLCCGFVTASHSFQDGESLLALKDTKGRWDKTQFLIAGNTVLLDDKSEGFAIEFSYPIDQFLNIGVEYNRAEVDVLSDSAGYRMTDGLFGPYPDTNRYVGITLISIIGRYKFNESGKIRPTLGAGYGNATFSLHSGTSVKLVGSSYQINASIDFMLTKSIALGLSAGWYGFDAKDGYQNSVKNNGVMGLLCLNFHL